MIPDDSNPLSADLDHVLKWTAPAVWDDLRNARIFITGGTGFFGRWLLESFAWANDRLRLGAKILVLSRDPSKFAQKATHLANRSDIEWHVGDVTNFSFPQGEFNHVIHAATEASAKLNEDEPLTMLDTVVNGTRRALDFAVHSGAKKFLLTSSGAIYGIQPPDLTHIPEDYQGAPDLTNPNAAYGEGKRLAELLGCIYARQHGLNVSIARCFAFVGPHLPLDAHFAIGNFIRDLLNGGPIRVAGDGSPYRSYMHAADLAVWLWTLLTQGKSITIVNVGSDEAVTIAELAEMISRMGVNPVPVQIANKARSDSKPSRYVPEIMVANTLQNLKVRIGLYEALIITLTSYN
jgi:nucleoside-diphosphate-sugar epimerase